MSRRMTTLICLLLAASLAGGLFIILSDRPSVFGNPASERDRPSQNESNASVPSDEPVSEEGAQPDAFRGVWVSSVYNLDYPSAPGLSVDQLKQEALSILDGAADIGFNAIFLQVRPTCDALYSSEIFPWSDYLSQTQGTAPEGGFDPLAFWIEEAHKRGLELHAWINPFRITRGNASNPKQDLDALAPSNPARQNPSWTVSYTDGGLYFNPGLPEVRRLVINGVSEIVRRYDVDGIHYDDYFYPGTDFDDAATYQTHGQEFTDRDNWRRDCIDRLIRDTAAAVREINPDCQFGVSPSGIWANKSSSSFGSDTRGHESYVSLFADTRKWVKSEWIDYICPQIYWQIGYDKADYETLLYWWADVARGTSVKLYIGQAAYRAGTGTSPGDAWYGTSEMIRQAALNATVPEVAGSIHFRYGSFVENPTLYETVKELYHTADSHSMRPDHPVMPVDGIGTLMVGRPNEDLSTTEKTWYLLGASDPNSPLYVNGDPVEDRSRKGFFGVFVDLTEGDNVFTFTQGDTSVTRTITRTTPAAAKPKQMDEAKIPPDSVFPGATDEYRRPGENITLKCTAPIGADVTVRLGGETFTMSPAVKTAPGDDYYATTYSYTYTLPQQTATGQIIELGHPVYSMSIDSMTDSCTAKAVQCITPESPYIAEVVSDWAYVFPKASSNGGPSDELCRGQQDYITGTTGDGKWVRLGMGAWIQRSDVKCSMGDMLRCVPGPPVYRSSDRWDTLTLPVSALTATSLAFDGQILTFIIHNASAAPQIVLPDDSPFSQATSSLTGGRAVYTLTLKAGQRIDGYYVSTQENALALHIKHPVRAGWDAAPLTGITILIDPGHGGSDTGALGPLGTLLPEKTINLYTSLKLQCELETLGATVSMTRSTDEEVSLAQRVEINRSLRPDLFLSVHGNSLDEFKDASSVQGISVWHRETVSGDFAEFLYDYLWNSLSLSKRGVHQANLYVTRPTWTPSIILETGFLCSPSDAEWLADNDAQNTLASAIAKGILVFFRQ